MPSAAIAPAAVSNVSRLRYRSGLKVPADAVYKVRHRQHRLPEEVTLLGSQTFPVCARCNGLVTFELLRHVIPAEDFRVALHQLVPIEQPAAAGRRKAG